MAILAYLLLSVAGFLWFYLIRMMWKESFNVPYPELDNKPNKDE
jgi:hypothetical protein